MRWDLRQFLTLLAAFSNGALLPVNERSDERRDRAEEHGQTGCRMTSGDEEDSTDEASESEHEAERRTESLMVE